MKTHRPRPLPPTQSIKGEHIDPQPKPQEIQVKNAKRKLVEVVEKNFKVGDIVSWMGWRIMEKERGLGKGISTQKMTAKYGRVEVVRNKSYIVQITEGTGLGGKQCLKKINKNLQLETAKKDQKIYKILKRWFMLTHDK